MVDYVLTTGTLQQEAYVQTERLGMHSDTNHNDAVDAFRHAYASARVVQMYGEYIAEDRGVSHEQDNWENANRSLRYDGKNGYQAVDLEQIKKEITMDMYNNEVGRRYGVENPNASQSELGDIIYQKGIKGNELIQSLDDPRIAAYENRYLKQISEYKQENALTLASNASTAEMNDFAFAALMEDDPKDLNAGMEQVYNTQVAQASLQQAQEVTQAYDQAQEAQAQANRGPVMSMG